MLHLSAISTPALELLKKLLSFNEFSELRLVGGTALALQTGHRKSIDLDLFGKVEMDKLPLAKLFEPFKTVEIIKKSGHINIFEINGVKVDFVDYSYPWLQDAVVIEGIRLAREKDIAAMKLAAITGRGTKKDFIDLYFLLRKYTLNEVVSFYNQKYFDASTYLAIKSLTYFDDAEQDMEPDMIIDIEWEAVKIAIKKKVMAYTEQYM